MPRQEVGEQIARPAVLRAGRGHFDDPPFNQLGPSTVVGTSDVFPDRQEVGSGRHQRDSSGDARFTDSSLEEDADAEGEVAQEVGDGQDIVGTEDHWR